MDVENDPDHVKQALADDIAQANAQLLALSAEMSAAELSRMQTERVAEANKELDEVVGKVKICRIQDRSYMQALPEAHRHFAALKKDANLAQGMKDKIDKANVIVEEKSKTIQFDILEEVKQAMQDNMNPEQYERLKIALENFDTFVPDMNAPSNAVMIAEAKRMLDLLYEVWKLKQLLMNLDQKAIAQVKSMNTPINEVHQVIRAVLLILGEDSKELKDWKSCRVNISRTGKQSLKRRIGAFTMETVTDKAQAQCEKIMKKIDLKRVEEVSSVVAIFYAFVKGALEVEQRMDADEEAKSHQGKVLPPLPSGSSSNSSSSSGSGIQQPAPPPPPPPPGGPNF